MTSANIGQFMLPTMTPLSEVKGSQYSYLGPQQNDSSTEDKVVALAIGALATTYILNLAYQYNQIPTEEGKKSFLTGKATNLCSDPINLAISQIQNYLVGYAVKGWSFAIPLVFIKDAAMSAFSSWNQAQAEKNHLLAKEGKLYNAEGYLDDSVYSLASPEIQQKMCVELSQVDCFDDLFIKHKMKNVIRLVDPVKFLTLLKKDLSKKEPVEAEKKFQDVRKKILIYAPAELNQIYSYLMGDSLENFQKFDEKINQLKAKSEQLQQMNNQEMPLNK